jgi:tRNA nucleotidyltransferase (CCA-adding enzyme)
MNSNNYTLDDFVVNQPITNTEMLAYAATHVNLPSDIAKKYREQVNSLRERLEKYINEHTDYDLVKMLHSGSVAKGTALRSLNDLDTAIYIKAAAVTDTDNSGLIIWLRDRLKEVYPDFGDDQLEPHEHCVTVHYKSPGLIDVDVVPVLYEGDPDNKGFLVTRSGDRVLTSISQHLDFIQKRKDRQPDHYIQFVRFAKYWVKQIKDQYEARGDHFRFKSLMVELICAHLADNGLDASNYTEALNQFFTYIVRTGLKEAIFFTDYYSKDEIDQSDKTIVRVYDPVNPENNIASTYSEGQRQRIVDEAKKALNAIVLAMNATTKQEAVENWKLVLGSTFRG